MTVYDFQLKEEALRKELHTTRMALIKQVCNHNTDAERIDDIVCLNIIGFISYKF
jgi:myotubularin-related protein 3/4